MPSSFYYILGSFYYIFARPRPVIHGCNRWLHVIVMRPAVSKPSSTTHPCAGLHSRRPPPPAAARGGGLRRRITGRRAPIWPYRYALPPSCATLPAACPACLVRCSLGVPLFECWGVPWGFPSWGVKPLLPAMPALPNLPPGPFAESRRVTGARRQRRRAGSDATKMASSSASTTIGCVCGGRGRAPFISPLPSPSPPCLPPRPLYHRSQYSSRKGPSHYAPNFLRG